MTVTSIPPRGGRTIEAQGSCRVDYANGGSWMVGCSAFGGGRGWLANVRHGP